MKHITGLAHIALFTKDLETSIKFYECLGGKVTGQADVQKPLGTNHIKIVSMPGFDLEIIEPHDGTDVTALGGLFPHIAIEVNDIDAAIADLKAAGITNFRGGVDKAADLPGCCGSCGVTGSSGATCSPVLSSLLSLPLLLLL